MSNKIFTLSFLCFITTLYCLLDLNGGLSQAASAPAPQLPQRGDYFASDSGFTPPCDESKFTPLHIEDAAAYCECVRDNRIANENWKYSQTPPMARDEIKHRALIAGFEAVCAQNNPPAFKLNTEENVYNSPPPGPQSYPDPRPLPPPQNPARPRNSPKVGEITNGPNRPFKLVAREPGCVYTGRKTFWMNRRYEDVEVCLAQHKSQEPIVLNLRPFRGGTGIVRLEGTFLMFPGEIVLNVTNLGGTVVHNGSTIPLSKGKTRF